MIANESFHHMLRLAQQAGLGGKKLPDMGYLTSATPEQMEQINGAYSAGRRVWHAEVIRRRKA